VNKTVGPLIKSKGFIEQLSNYQFPNKVCLVLMITFLTIPIYSTVYIFACGDFSL
jgi:hypothetical protein